jgi:hypothetical protein
MAAIMELIAFRYVLTLSGIPASKSRRQKAHANDSQGLNAWRGLSDLGIAPGTRRRKGGGAYAQSHARVTNIAVKETILVLTARIRIVRFASSNPSCWIDQGHIHESYDACPRCRWPRCCWSAPGDPHRSSFKEPWVRATVDRTM